MASDPGGTVAKPAKAMFDSKALNGLRGLASLHIVLYHGFWYSEAKIGTYAQVKHIRNVPVNFIFTGLQIFKESTLVFLITDQAPNNHPGHQNSGFS